LGLGVESILCWKFCGSICGPASHSFKAACKFKEKGQPISSGAPKAGAILKHKVNVGGVPHGLAFTVFFIGRMAAFYMLAVLRKHLGAVLGNPSWAAYKDEPGPTRPCYVVLEMTEG
jgi:hypothetical protein